MKLLNKIITERLDGYTCKLDIYEMTFTTYDDGHIKHVSKDMFKQPGMKRYSCLMIDYFSLGVQGFVGSSFELHRPGKRALNILMYTAASAKWVFMKKFPPINEALESISTVPEAMKQDTKLTDEDRARWLEQASEADRKQVMMFRVAGPKTHCHGRKMGWAKEPKARHMCTASDFGEGIDADLPVIRSKPIEIDIQNVARFWGRNIDVWNNPHKEDSAGSQLSNRNGVTDSTNWTPQYAGDGKVELFSVKDIGDYALNQMPGRSDYRINRLAQMASPLALHFRAPEDYPPRTNNPLTSRKNIEQGLLYGMCDGEFIELYHPRDIVISRKVTLKAIGRSPETSRIVLDTIKNDGLDAVQMDATAAADTTQSGRPADVNNYVASPFQRIFKFSRRQTGASNTSATTGGDSTSARSSTGQLLKSPVLAAVSGGPSRSSSTARRSTFNSIRNSMLFRSGSLSRSRKTSFNESDASGTTVTLSNAVHHDSPLKNPPTSAQSTLSMRRKSLTGSDGLTALAKANNSELPLKAHPTHRAHSKSLDITATRAKNHMTDCEAAEVLVAEPASVDMPAKSESTPSDATAKKDESRRASYTSSSDSSDTDAESHASIINPTSRNSADSTSTPISPITAHGHCLMTIGKDVVENVENFRLKDDASTSNNSDDVQHLLSTSKTPDAAHTVPPMEVS
ncbi:hypothetical protein FBU59_003165 [Linderina macrospora]|uniref:Uncharacterized protein n=1 Tax=Linderina macrospora TaxID=4868 RepID=A0ACC1J925_9FUNG|nr:hypothetical protein FBU59_003165 [Linderina macrospora]